MISILLSSDWWRGGMMHYDGETVDLPEDEARRVLANGFGEVDRRPRHLQKRYEEQVQTATTGPTNNASTRPAGPAGKRRKGAAA